MIFKPSNEPIPEGYVRAFPLTIHENATFSFEDFEDRLELKLTNKETGLVSQRPYYKLEEGLSVHEAHKINMILRNMSREIGLDLWNRGMKKL